MDSFDIKSEKANAIKKHRQRRQKIGSFFRLLEVLIVLVLISKVTDHLPISVNFSRDHFKDLSMAVVSPSFVFVIGNIIVLILFVKCNQFSAQDSAKSSPKTDFYEEFLERSERSQSIYRDENREKQSTLEEANIVTEDTHPCALEFKQYRRSQSEKSKTVNCDKSNKELRRTVTEKGRGLAKKSYPEDNMSNEEFRQTVEAFIARKQRLIREEELCVH
ncbi:hypothetical protein HS088_TW02G00092 [Tripterygium wilfordii]|uniref:DUF4408 domain-containing protein n=1 Tax=Tripterygium wilfordii TaxID=458696 RepID=A0A7J7DXI9_TRIWF|nr:uncharacterized protein LOC120013849 [Tripterygium wilfordii]KAF5751082.1 hypothetical protein HS088_TW02G00092 [Tripterygium wilfordii]